MNRILAIFFVVLWGQGVPAQGGTPSDRAKEENVRAYALPDPLVCEDGSRVSDAKVWEAKRRGELLKAFEEQVYGRMPGRAETVTAEVRSVEAEALGGLAVRKEIRLTFAQNGKTARLELLVYLPKGAAEPVPVFLGLNYWGNSSISKEAGIATSEAWMREGEKFGIVEHRATEATRGSQASRWPLELILRRGYGAATFYYGDVARDDAGCFSEGVFPLFYQAGQSRPGAAEWGAIGAWAWGLSRAMDYLATEKAIDAARVAVIGHSRQGKAALWAGAEDRRFAMVISNCSGCGGAMLSRRRAGQTVKDINTRYPFWFCENFHRYNDKEDSLPVDQHELAALIAPRPLYIASASEDLHADPKGEFLSAVHADPVYRLLGTEGFPLREFPAVNQPSQGRIGYHVREGKHDITEYDWRQYLDFADKHLKVKAPAGGGEFRH